jgi:hypothetical protein
MVRASAKEGIMKLWKWWRMSREDKQAVSWGSTGERLRKRLTHCALRWDDETGKIGMSGEPDLDQLQPTNGDSYGDVWFRWWRGDVRLGATNMRRNETNEGGADDDGEWNRNPPNLPLATGLRSSRYPSRSCNLLKLGVWTNPASISRTLPPRWWWWESLKWDCA